MNDSEMIKDPEEFALMLLKEVILLGKAGKPYKKELTLLGEILPKAPGVRKYILEICATLQK